MAADVRLWQVVLSGREWAPEVTNYADARIHLIGWRTFDHWPPPSDAVPVRAPSDDGALPDLWVVRVVVRHPNRPGWIEWTRWGAYEETVEMRGLLATTGFGAEEASAADLAWLAGARVLVQDVPRRSAGGRPVDTGDYTAAQFLMLLGRVLRQHNRPPETQDTLAAWLAQATSESWTQQRVQRYLKRIEVRWVDVKRSRWPRPAPE